MENKTQKKEICVSLTWRRKKNGKFFCRYFLNSYWAINNTAEFFANGIDDTERDLYRVIRKGGKIVCREATYTGV